jgi:23S rRNA-/tRNA-specific pseudouridylate synthase
MVDLFPETGRTHQLRIHLSQIGHPIAGDKLYGIKGNILKHKGLFLCATRLEIIHPELNRSMVFEIDPPNKFKALMEREKRRWNKYNEK